MGLFATSNSDKLWIGEAIGQKIVKAGSLIDVESIQAVRDGRGYLICANHQGTSVFDYVWKNSAGGKVLTTCFADPGILSNQRMSVTAQDKVRNAQLDTVEKTGRVWQVETNSDGLLSLGWSDATSASRKDTDKVKPGQLTLPDTLKAA